jgi:CheY-like chemotaxis protein
MITYSPGNEAEKKSVLIVDDHYVVRRGLVEFLSQQPDLAVCDAVASAKEAMEVVEHEPVDLAIIDISLGGVDGLMLTDMLKREHPELIVLILSMHDALPASSPSRKPATPSSTPSIKSSPAGCTFAQTPEPPFF